MRNKHYFLLLAIMLSLGGASCTAQAVPTPTPTLTPTLTPMPGPPTPTPTLEPPTLSPTPELVEISVYFTDSARYAEGTPPFEAPVIRFADPSSNLPEAVMSAFFEGPTEQERDQGLELIASGFTGFSALTIEDGIARIYLTGECRSLGGTYTIAQPIMENLLQFPDVEHVKIYDETGNTEVPEGRSNSIPFCLEP